MVTLGWVYSCMYGVPGTSSLPPLVTLGQACSPNTTHSCVSKLGNASMKTLQFGGWEEGSRGQAPTPQAIGTKLDPQNRKKKVGLL